MGPPDGGHRGARAVAAAGPDPNTGVRERLGRAARLPARRLRSDLGIRSWRGWPSRSRSTLPSIRAPRRARPTALRPCTTCGTWCSITTSCSTRSICRRRGWWATRSGAWSPPRSRRRHPSGVAKLVLIAPLGLWRDDAPIPNYMVLPAEELPKRLFADPAGPLAQAFAALPQNEDDGNDRLIQAHVGVGLHGEVRLAAGRSGPAPPGAPDHRTDAGALRRARRPRAPRLRGGVRTRDSPRDDRDRRGRGARSSTRAARNLSRSGWWSSCTESPPPRSAPPRRARMARSSVGR